MDNFLIISNHGAFIGGCAGGSVVWRRANWPSPGTDDAILAGGDEAILTEDERRQPLMGDFLTNERLQHWNLVQSRASLCANQPERISAARHKRRIRGTPRRRGSGRS